MNTLDDETPDSYDTQGYFTIPVIELDKWQLKSRLDSDIPGHYRSMVFHQCEKAPYDRYMNGLKESLKCTYCSELMPNEIQIIWKFMNLDLMGRGEI